MALYAKHKDTTFQAGDTVKVHYRLIEKEKVAGKAKREVKEEIRERTQIFEGIVISIRGEGVNKSFTVRRIGVDSIGIERIFPLISPWIKKITVSRQAHVRRAKLYYLRQKLGKEKDRLKEKELPPKKETVNKVSKKTVKVKQKTQTKGKASSKTSSKNEKK